MDAFTSLCDAVRVVHFLDFASGLLTEPGLHQPRLSLSVDAFDQIINEITNLDRLLTGRSDAFPASAADIATAEYRKTLQRIVLDCSRLAQELVKALRSLRAARQDIAEAEGVGRTGRIVERCTWTSFLQAFRTLWNTAHIAALLGRLAAYREELVLRVLVYLNLKRAGLLLDRTDLPDSFYDPDTQIVEILAYAHEKPIRPTEDPLDGDDVTIATVLMTLNSGDTASLVLPSLFDPLSVGSSPQTVLQLVMQPHQGGRVEASLWPLDGEKVQQQVLDSLHFYQIEDRIEDVKEAHQSTFRWIFESPSSSEAPWSNFSLWLESEESFYWINGRAGSGKSTLMKFICQDPRTWTHLDKWSPVSSRAQASFFFWNLGLRLQKSQTGLLRSLLHTVLSQRPDLIVEVMPELCREVTHPDFSGISEPDLDQLTDWFKRLVSKTSPDFRIFFAIDGIDEYEGDYQDLIELITATTSPNVKFLLSSRPIPSCVQAFSSYPGLQLQSLTRDDILGYCQSAIGKSLSSRDNKEWFGLIEQIVERSSGVFLWATLVVKTLFKAYQEGAKLSELQARLNELPADLSNLYAHLLGTIPTAYRAQASRIFQIFESSREVEPAIRGHPLLAIQLSLADQDWNTADGGALQKMSRKEEQRRVHDIDSLIQTYCCGMLELQTREYKRRPKGIAERLLGPSAIIRPHVDFIHKTVLEFLQDEETWVGITSWAKFNPYHALFRSCILLAKANSPTEVVHPQASLIWESMYAGLRYAQIAEVLGRPIAPAALDELDTVLSQHWDHSEVYVQGRRWGPGRYASSSQAHWSVVLFWDNHDGENEGSHPAVRSWDEEMRTITAKNWDIRGLVSPDDQTRFLRETRELGFLRPAVVYSLGSYIKTRIQAQPKDKTRRLLRFWLELLQSSFHVRLRIPGPATFSQLLLEAVLEPTPRLNDSDAFTVWNIFLTELFAAMDLDRLTQEECHRVEVLCSRFLGSLGIGAGHLGFHRTIPSGFKSLLASRLNTTKFINADLYECLQRLLEWLNAETKGFAQDIPGMGEGIMAQDISRFMKADNAPVFGELNSARKVRFGVARMSGFSEALKNGKRRLLVPLAKSRSVWAESRKER